MSRVALLGCFLMILHYSVAQENFLKKKDMRGDWLVQSGGLYKPYADREANTTTVVYFILDTEVFKGDRLMIEGNQVFSVFCEGVLVQDQIMKLNSSVDSLAKLFINKSLFIGIHQRGGIKEASLKTIIGTELPFAAISEGGPLERKYNTLQNLTVVTLLILITFFSVMLRLNPRRTAHCFSAIKLFSAREGDDSQSLNRIGSWGNILFYVFASLLTGLVLLFFWNEQAHEPNQNAVFHVAFLWWVETSFILLSAFFVKALLLKLFTIIFNLREQMGFQFLNFMRTVTLSMVLMMLSVLIFRVLVPEGKLAIFYDALPWILVGWLILVFIKLLNRVHASVFHLFSYICITELLPILFIVKVLYE